VNRRQEESLVGGEDRGIVILEEKISKEILDYRGHTASKAKKIYFKACGLEKYF